MQIKISEAAGKDVRSTYKYYTSIEKDLGIRFKTEFYSKLEDLKKVPTSGFFLYNKVRCRVLKVFPYIIL